MLQLTYSNRTEALLERLAERIRKAWSRDGRAGVWEPILIVVPNPHMQEYVRIELARRLGVVANLRFSYLNGLWRELLRSDRIRILSSDLLRNGIFQVLDDKPFLDRPELGPVRHYLEGDANGLKSVQLATELARVFEEYQYSRPEWIRKWRAGKGAGSVEAPAETWQRLLWLKVVNTLDGSAMKHLTLAEALQDVSFSGAHLPSLVFAFGLSHVAQVYHEVYTRIGQLPGVDFHIFALNPCAEFWEDLVTEKERQAPRPGRVEARRGPQACSEELGDMPEGQDEDLYGLAEQGPEALRRWGRPGRENIRLLNEVSGCDFHAAFEFPPGESLLERIQADILCFQEPSAARAAGADASVRFLASPSARREAEIIATEIWRLMEQHAGTEQPLSFSDIAVIVPPAQQALYLAHLQAAFEETHRIPWIQSDGAPPVMKQTLEAVELLLELPTSGLTRAAVLRILANPALGRRFENLDSGTWPRWCETVGIVRGADQESWKGTYLEQDALNWDQGLQRLALGAFMVDGCEVRTAEGSYLPHAAADAESAGTFLTLVRSLLEDAGHLVGAKLELRDWVQGLESYLAKWLEAEDELSVRSFERIRSYLARLADGVPEGLEMPEMGFVAARFLVLEALASLRGEQPVNLSRGVVVASYTPMRAIPFRAVFLMGLGEGVFPTRDQKSALDLRANRRQAGDVSQTEKEKYLFLETLLSTREHLVLSYVALDELSGEKFEPSGLFKEFRGLVDRYLPVSLMQGNGQDPLLEAHPLRRFDPGYFSEWFPVQPARTDAPRNYSPVAQTEARALWLRQQVAGGRPLTLPPALGRLPLSPQPRTLLEEWLGSPGFGTPRPPESVLRISLSDLRKWLECPLTGAAAIRLGLRQEELEDRSAVEDECFESEFLETWVLLRKVVWKALREGKAIEVSYNELLEALQAKAAAPFGLFAEAERDKNLELIRGWLDYLKAQPGKPETWRFGSGRFGSAQAEHLEPALSLVIQLGDRPQRIELTGELRPQWGGSLFLESGKPPADSGLAELRKKALGAYLEHVVLSWKGPSQEGHGARFVFQQAKKDGRAKDAPMVQEKVLPFKPLAPDLARRILERWVLDLLTGDHDVLLPIEAVIEGWSAGELTPDSIRQFVDEALEQAKRGSGFSTLRGPVPEPIRYEPPSDPWEIAQQRYGDFLEQILPTVERAEVE